jgi:hypothetical protein
VVCIRKSDSKNINDQYGYAIEFWRLSAPQCLGCYQESNFDVLSSQQAVIGGWSVVMWYDGTYALRSCFIF